jgi:hypothetical protein
MLSPALRQLFLELDKFDLRKRSAFENDLHSELLQIAQILGVPRRVRTEEQGEAVALPALADIKRDIEGSPVIRTYIDLGTGPVSTTVNTKCSKPDCPNKRKK